MPPKQRHQKFLKLFASIDAPKNIDRIRRVCEILFVKPNTVRGWCMADPHRYPPESQVLILERELGRK